MISRNSLFFILLMGSLSYGQNLDEHKIFENYNKLDETFPQKKLNLSLEELESLYQELYHNPVSSLSRLQKYDPTGEIGFCFGRAQAAYLLARSKEVKKSSLKQLFIIGDLRSNGESPEWRFHVTTIIQDTKGTYYALDVIMGKLLPVQEWIKNVREGWDRWTDSKRKPYSSKLYLTAADNFIPDIRHVPDVDSEMGNHIIEISFDPIEKTRSKDFKKMKFQNHEVFKVFKGRKYFMSPGEAEDSRFKFDGITIDGIYIHYNNYFADLMEFFEGKKSFVRGYSTPMVLDNSLPQLSVQEHIALWKNSLSQNIFTRSVP